MKLLRGCGAWAPRARSLALGAGLATLLAPLAAAAPPEIDARAWLLRMRQAASSVNYQGTMVVSAGGAMSSSRVWHYCVGDQRYERLEAQDGQQQSVYRHNDEVRTLWPQSRVAVAERREALASWPALPNALDPRVLESYELRPEGHARVAGRDATVFVLAPRDALRFAQRLWADAASGLMLRADVLGPGRQVLESTAFSEVEIGVKPQPEAVLQTIRRLDAAAGEGRLEGRSGWQVLRPLQRRTQLEAEGWALRQSVPGFALAGCALRTLAHAPDAQPVLQAVFSDGLTHVSLFIEPFRPERHRVEAVQQLGATGTVARRHGEHWVTAVGDVPAATLVQLTGALERRR